MKHLLIITALLLFCCPTHAQHPDTIKVYFDLGKPTLSSTAKQLLDSLAYYDILPVRKKYGIIGYADYIGSEESNITLSKQRAASAEQYLLGLGVKKENIERVRNYEKTLKIESLPLNIILLTKKLYNNYQIITNQKLK